jgi:hypothetical protein
VGVPRVNCSGGAEEYRRGDSEEEKDGDAAAALPHAVAPVRAPSVYWFGGAPRGYCCGGAEEYEGGGSEEEKGGLRGCCVAAHARPRQGRLRPTPAFCAAGARRTAVSL